jgi:hypothetical protein
MKTEKLKKCVDDTLELFLLRVRVFCLLFQRREKKY